METRTTCVACLLTEVRKIGPQPRMFDQCIVAMQVAPGPSVGQLAIVVLGRIVGLLHECLLIGPRVHPRPALGSVRQEPGGVDQSSVDRISVRVGLEAQGSEWG